MTSPIFNPQPNYSGVTIQISNPSVNVGPYGADITAGKYNNPLIRSGNYSACPQACYYEQGKQSNPIQGAYGNEQTPDLPLVTDEKGNPVQNNPSQYPNAYPAQYYMNNYNYGVNGNRNNTGDLPSDKVNENVLRSNNINGSNGNELYGEGDSPEYSVPDRDHSMNSYRMYADSEYPKQTDMTTSKEIIADLNDREAKLQEEKKNTKETKIVALTDEYIKSLENYLNNPNDEIRLMASKEILTRLDEDKDRYNDAALNALLNKMMQDPSKTVRVAALSAFASQLASGNDYTVKLLRDIQANPKSDKEDVLQAADILLKMSAGVEVKNVPNPKTNENKQQ